MQRALAILLIAAFWLGAAALLYGVHAYTPEMAITQAEFLASDQADLPRSDDPAWQSVRLPHVWTDSDDLAGLRYGWYRLAIDPVAARAVDGPVGAVLLWNISMNARAYLNGTWLGDGGSMEDPIARNQFRPLLFKVREESTAGKDELLILLRGMPPGEGFMGPIVTGPTAELEGLYRLRHGLKVSFLHLGAMLIAAIALPMAFLGLWRPHDSVYGWFASFGILFAANIAIFTSRDVSLPAPLWEWLFAASINTSLVALLLFVHRFLNIHRPRLERILWLIWAVAAVALAGIAWFQPEAVYFWSRRVWITASVLMSVYPAMLILLVYWQRLRDSGFVLMLAGTLMLLLGVHDALSVNHWWVDPMQGYWTHYAVPLTFLIFSYILLQRFDAALHESESLNRDLEHRVRDKQREIEAKHAELRTVEEQRTLATERERILRDMHDGLGGTLVSTISRLESEGKQHSHVAESLRSVLNDLRLMLFSLEPGDRALRAELAMLRERLAAQASDAGLEFDWTINNLDDSLTLGRRGSLQLMRIIQEAFTNTVKHAQASRFRVLLTGQTGGKVHLELADDGCGFDPQAAGRRGYGLNSMRARAERIGSALRVESDAGGTRVQLEFSADGRRSAQ